jgi:hypothetical protein
MVRRLVRSRHACYSKNKRLDLMQSEFSNDQVENSFQSGYAGRRDFTFKDTAVALCGM